jgi:hypothetical protein
VLSVMPRKRAGMLLRMILNILCLTYLMDDDSDYSPEVSLLKVLLEILALDWLMSAEPEDTNV